MRRFFDTSWWLIATYTLVTLVVGYTIAGEATYRLAAALAAAFLLGIHLGFGEAVLRLKARQTARTRPS